MESGVRRRAFSVATLLILLSSALFSLANDKEEPIIIIDPVDNGLVPVWERYQQPYNVTGPWSTTLLHGVHDVSEVSSVYVPVTLPSDEGGCATTGDCEVHMGLWLPVMEGCDLTISPVPDECRVPVITDVGPYYDDGDVDALTPANRLGRFLIENMVPHGYAVAQVSVFGTGESNHCMDFMGYAEQMGIDAAVTWLGEQEWSNGNVGIVGKSYDGTTPWQAATFGNPYLKTIIPISGLIGVHDLMWRNGSMEARGLAMHNGVYGSFSFDGDEGDVENFCQGYVQGYLNGPAAYMLGDEVDYLGNDYWSQRHFLTRALENYNGSIYFIHGMQDWNVDPHMAFPTYNTLLDYNLEVKGLFGQWGHDYPDRLGDHDFLRYDWAQDLLEWFEHYLAERGPKPYLHVEMQDQMGQWRVEESWPAADTNYIPMTFGEGLSVISGSGLVSASTTLLLESEPFENETRIAGMPTFHLDVTIPPTQTSGHLFLEMYLDGEHLGHAVMDLRYHAGGRECGQPCAAIGTVNAKMEFFPMDVVIPAGKSIEIRISHTGDDYVPAPVSEGFVTIGMNANSILTLPLIDRGADALFFTPPVWTTG
tara:strand:+ start:2402 stop:4177 length:1776 start_codon:yes stop_codon:yes gene_type:complete